MSCRNVTMTWQSSLSVRTRRSGQMERRPSLMAEVLEFWPQKKPKAEARFSYPWAQWMALDEDGIGDIWLAEPGIDWPADANARSEARRAGKGWVGPCRSRGSQCHEQTKQYIIEHFTHQKKTY